ncbi:AAA family ATPase [Cardinium endosymbiont of Dermatophagoides farinae]|uniref:AAA family ATPase n=1 Tax=Cardinium endosymbiont of Dermatophagoides farinae TaxID=2597823 RepID=UPI001642A266|nr:AAA family ATPase [Cardinium endosymbiont of Dermatophagoides farinae]
MEKDKVIRKIDALPIGYSDVKSVIETGYYVDKTKYAQELIEKRNPIFIARPRRFGKSLFIDTLDTICSGEQEVFKDYHIGRPENGYTWKKYPIINIDFSGLNHNPNCLENSLKSKLDKIACLYGLTIQVPDIQDGLENLIEALSKLSNGYESNIVVLIDEYDAPVVNLQKGSDLEQANIKVMKDFFMTLKSLNKRFQFTFITGVSKFSLSDVFSGANHLSDLTIDKSAAAMFGYTEQELLEVFSDRIAMVAATWSEELGGPVTQEKVMQEIASHYNGYKFYEKGPSVYNPWSTLHFFKEGKREDYWYESGSSTLIISQMLSDPDRFNLDELPIDAYRHQLMYTGSRSEISLKALMFQTGYLTIAHYEPSTGIYKLKFPNQEVAKAFAQTIQDTLERRVKDYFIQERDKIRHALADKKIDTFIEHINIAFAALPYYIRPLSKAICDQQFLGEAWSSTAEYSAVFEECRQASTPKLPSEIEFRKRSDTKQEKQYYSNLHMLLQGLGFLGGRKMHMHSESASSQGRSDIVLELETAIFIIEIKYKSSGKIALEQIKANGYYKPYLLRQKAIILLGINFNEETRMIDNWDYEIHEDHIKK